MIASLDDWGGVDAKAFASTVVDLAQRGWLTITEENDDHLFTAVAEDRGRAARDYEAASSGACSPAGAAVVTQDELVDEADGRPHRVGGSG